MAEYLGKEFVIKVQETHVIKSSRKKSLLFSFPSQPPTFPIS